jgi:hypothetical protein
VLLQRKADPAAANRKGQTAADLCDEPDLKQLLLEAQAQRASSTAGSEWLVALCAACLSDLAASQPACHVACWRAAPAYLPTCAWCRRSGRGQAAAEEAAQRAAGA